jgi:hypothetical protein
MAVCHWVSSSRCFCLDHCSLEDDGNRPLLSQCCSITSQKNGILNFTTVKTSKLAQWLITLLACTHTHTLSFLLATTMCKFIHMLLAAERLDCTTAFYRNITHEFLNFTGKCTCVPVKLPCISSETEFWNSCVKTSDLFFDMLEFTVAEFYLITSCYFNLEINWINSVVSSQ